VDTTSRVLIGFDGFIDTLLHCVEQRLGPHSFKRLSSIPRFSQKVRAASSHSANIECVVKEQSIGGNAPLLARALATLGHKGTLIGACGYPSKNPIFDPLATLGLTIHSFADPGLTDALEFTDGKLLLGKMGELNHLTLQEIRQRLPCNLIDSLIEHAEILATVNWTMMPMVGEFWEYLLKNPRLVKKGPRKSLFVDLADPAKRPVKDLKKALSSLSELNFCCDIILGLNSSESLQVLGACRLSSSPSLQINAEKIASALQLSSVVIHTHPEVAVATLKGEDISSYGLCVPICKNPVRSTGAGDTFNAGFLAGVLQHRSPLLCLKMAAAASNVFVRTGVPPTPKTMKAWLQH
jgi:sugar/nucleoside kinase (ribokinase family)